MNGKSPLFNFLKESREEGFCFDVVDLLLYVPPIVCGGSVLVFVLVCITLYGLSRFAIILTRKRKLVALLLLSFGCLVTVNVL